MNDTGMTAREAALRNGLALEYLTVGWNVVEGVVAVTAALTAGSVALLGFGVDSFVECTSGVVLLWRLSAEQRGMGKEAIEQLDGRAHRLVALTLFALAGYVAVEAGLTLYRGEHPEPTMVGIALTAVSIVAMQWLARAKRRIAARLASRALEADAFQTTACFWLSIITLAGIGLNAAFGWWWADPIAALAMTWFIGKEGREAWRGEECGCEPALTALPQPPAPNCATPSCGCSSSDSPLAACEGKRSPRRG